MTTIMPCSSPCSTSTALPRSSRIRKSCCDRTTTGNKAVFVVNAVKIPARGRRRMMPAAADAVLLPFCGLVALLVILYAPLPAQSFSLAPRTAFLSRSTTSSTVNVAPFTSRLYESKQDDNVDEDEDDLEPAVQLPYDNELPLSAADLENLTVPQLKQQLRLRGLKVSGRKLDLTERLMRFSGTYVESRQEENDDDDNNEIEPEMVNPGDSSAKQFAKDRGKELIDVTAYLDEDDQGSTTRTSGSSSSSSSKEKELTREEKEELNEATNEPEVWGADARIVDDYEGRKLIVDSLSSSVIEFTGSNQTAVQAFVVASRDAWRPFLSGGRSNNMTNTPAEDRLREIQTKREQASRQPIRFEESPGLDVDDENGLYTNVILDREFSDWGKYTQTGAQLSASEVQGVLLLSDVYGAFSDDTRALAEKIAFECQPVVVMVPDLFRGEPWEEGESTPGVNEKGQDYEQWRALHDDLRVSVDIRAAASSLRDSFGVSSVVVWGTCYGGGRALEAAAGVLPNNSIHDIDGSIGPPLVDPIVAVAWYPTRYNAGDLFGKEHKGTNKDTDGNRRSVAVMAVFGGEDTIPGATKEDAAELKQQLEEDDRVNDLMVKVFPGQDHGFAHVGLGRPGDSGDVFEQFVDEEFGGSGRVALSDGDSEVACLLSTAFMETYSRVFLPTVGAPISLDEQESEWSADLEMKDLTEANKRDVREEIEESLDSFVEEPLGGYRIDPTDDAQEDELAEVLRSMEDPAAKTGPYALAEDDDLVTIYAKLKASDENFQIF